MEIDKFLLDKKQTKPMELKQTLYIHTQVSAPEFNFTATVTPM